MIEQLKFLIQLLAKSTRKAVRDGPITQVGDQDGVKDSWLQPGPEVAFLANAGYTIRSISSFSPSPADTLDNLISYQINIIILLFKFLLFVT